MNASLMGLSQPIVERVGWTLVHFLWQGIAVAALSAPVLLILRRRSPHVRYLVACVGLLLMALAPVITFAVLPSSASVTPLSEIQLVLPEFKPHRGAQPPATAATLPMTAAAPAVLPPPAPVVAPRRPWTDRAQDFIAAHLKAFVAVWLAGVVLLSTRLAAGWIGIQRLRRRGTPDLPEALIAATRRLALKLGIRRAVVLLRSVAAVAPVTLGCLRPVVILPASLLSGMTPAQIESILAHELAHIRRYDYLVNLAQTLAETILFYHPAVHWLSHRIRVEREHCCDDLAVAVCGDSTTYARALARIAEIYHTSARLVPAATGGTLLHRIQRLLGIKPERETLSSRWLAGGITIAVLVILAGGVALSTAAQTKEEQQPQSTQRAQSDRKEREAPSQEKLIEVVKARMGEGEYRLPNEEEIKTLGVLWPSVAPEENAAYYFQRAAAALASAAGIPAGSAASEKPYDGNVEAVREWIASNAEALQRVREGIKQKTYRSLPLIATEQGVLISDLASLSGLRQLARTLTDAGFLCELQERPDDAADACLQCIEMGALIRRNGVLIEGMVGAAVGSIGQRSLDQLMAQGQVSDAKLAEIAGKLREADVTPDEMQEVWKLESAFAEATIAMNASGAPPDHPFYTGARVYYAAVAKWLSERPWTDLLQAGIVEDLQKKGALPKDQPGYAAAMRAIQELGRVAVRLRFTQLRAALELQRRRAGAWPASLDALVPALLPSLPADPFAPGGAPIRYAREGDGWKLWSVGANNVDDRAAVDPEKYDPARFQIWDGPDYVLPSALPSNLDTRMRNTTVRTEKKDPPQSAPRAQSTTGKNNAAAPQADSAEKPDTTVPANELPTHGAKAAGGEARRVYSGK